MTLVIRVPGSFTDNTLPKLKKDKILPDGNGALFLFRPDLDADTSYIDSSTGFVQNIAWDSAANIVSGGTQNNLRGVTNKLFTSLSGKVDKSAKGGLNVIASQSNAVSNHGFEILLPDNIKSYIIANSAHNFFVSLWAKVTRPDINSTAQMSYAAIANTATGIANRLFIFRSDGNVPVFGRSQSMKTNGDKLRNIAATWSGTVPTTPANMRAYLQVGNRDIFAGFNLGQSGSMVIYKYYVEDLTVSGRSYAEVDALDFAMHTEAFSSGGKYFGDTFTDPATLP